MYPDICMNIAKAISREVTDKLDALFKRTIKNEMMFLRMSPAGVQPPHYVHHDKSMGDYSLMIYLNTKERAGTGLFRHKDIGMTYAPEDQFYEAIAQSDTKKMDKWYMYSLCEMQENRAYIFDSGYLHAAMPVGGFGLDQASSRIVLTCFFS